ncbi:MAG: hypothetical protein N4A46_03090 [Schleiferiaceae bacterium]|jgi:hypothetical protein|nr:hypothetical protein [Schleiferiaceae bacterium]
MSSEWEDIKNELRGGEAPLSDHAWDDMNSLLDQQAKTKRKKVLLWLVPLLFIGFSSVAIWLWPESEDSFQNPEYPVTNELEIDATKPTELPANHSSDENETVEQSGNNENLEMDEASPSNQEKPRSATQPIAKNLKQTSQGNIQDQTHQVSESRLNQKGYDKFGNPKISNELVAHDHDNSHVTNLEGSKKSDKGWKLKVFAGPTYNMPNIQYNQETGKTHKNLDLATADALKAGWGFDAGVELSYQFNRFLKIGSGLKFRKIVTQNNYTHRENEIPVIDSASGQIVGYIPTGNLPPISGNAFANNSFTYVGIPVSLFYEHPLNNKWFVYGEFVNSFNFLLNQNSYLVNNQTLELNTSRDDNFNPLIMSYQFRVGLRYALNPKVSVAFEPAYRGHYNNLYSTDQVVWKPQDLSFNLALIYTL